MRFVKKDVMEPEEYIKQLNMREVATILKLKLNMVETKANFPNKYDDRMCIMCKREEETTEHLFKCETYRRLSIEQPTSMERPRRRTMEIHGMAEGSSKGG